MKKNLLLAAMALAAMPSFAAVENATYEDNGDYTFKNISMNTQLNGDIKTLAGQKGYYPTLDVIPTAILVKDVVYVVSFRYIDDNGDLVRNPILVKFDAKDGKLIGTQQLTLNGQPFTPGDFGAYRIGRDDFDNLYFAPILFAKGFAADGAETPKIYTVDVETGAVNPELYFWLSEDFEGGYKGRVDWVDIVGDVTRKEAGCTLMAAPRSGQDGGNEFKCSVYGFDWAKGAAGNEWTGHFDADWGKAEVLEIPENSVPGECTVGQWKDATTITIVRDEDFSASQFYVDDMKGYPCYFNSGGALLGTFNSLKDTDKVSLIPDMTPNGIQEFSFGDDIFIVYVMGDWNKGSLSNICRLGEGADFEGMEKMYTFPQSDMGDTTDMGRRLSTYDIKIKTDENGKQGAYIMHYKSGQGYTYNLFAQKGFQDESNGVSAIETENNAPVEFFNLQGIRVANPENGIFIRRQGSEVSKVVR